MSPETRRHLPLLAPVVLGVVVAYDVVSTWLARVAYPYDLEWMEGGVLAHAWRVQQGLPVYAEPSAEWAPMVYTPGYYGVLAALSLVFDLGHPLGRSVSILGTSAAAAAIVFATARQGRNLLAGLVGAAVWLGCYEASGAFYDLVRADALAMGLLAWSLALAPERDARTQVGAGVLLALAFACKHNVAAFGAPVVLGLWGLHGWRAALRYGLAALVPAGLLTLYWTLSSDGYFLGYVIEVPRSHPFVESRAMPGTVAEMGVVLPVATAVIGLWALARAPFAAGGLPRWLTVGLTALGGVASIAWIASLDPARGVAPATSWELGAASLTVGIGVVAAVVVTVGMALAKRVDGPWVLGAGLVATAAIVGGMMRAHHGGFTNVYMPLHLAIAGAFAFALADLSRRHVVGAVIAALLGLGQLGIQWSSFKTDRLIPTDEDVAAGDALVAALAEHEGPYLSLYAPWIAYQAGGEPGMHLIALWDLNHKQGPYRPYVRKVRAAIDGHAFGVVVDARKSVGYGVVEAYPKVVQVPMHGRALMPRTGWRRRPDLLRFPASDPPAGDDAPPAPDAP